MMLSEIPEKTADVVTIFSDFFRNGDISAVFLRYMDYYRSNELLVSLSSLSFIENPIIQSAVKASIGLAVAIVTLLSIYKYISLQSDVDGSLNEMKEVFRRTMITTALIAIFPMLFAGVSSIGDNLTEAVGKAGHGDGFAWSGTLVDFVFQEPFFIDHDPSKPLAILDEAGKVSRGIDVNERCESDTPEGCKAPEKPWGWLTGLKTGNAEYYRYEIDFGSLKMLLVFFTMGNYLIIISVLARSFKVAFLYIMAPIATAFNLSDNLQYLGKAVSSQLYAGVFQVGIQLLAVKVISVISVAILPQFFGGSGIAWILIQIVAFCVILGIPKFINNLVGSGMSIVGKIKVKIPNV